MDIPNEFQEPTSAQEEFVALDKAATASEHGPETITFNFRGETITVSGFERTLLALSSPGDRAQLVKAGLVSSGTSLDEEAWHTVARAAVAPETAVAQLRSLKGQTPGLVEEHVEGATLRSLHTRAWLSELFPGHQPRTGQQALPVTDPEVRGDVDDDGRPYARVVYRYRDWTHLRSYLHQTITETRHANPEAYDRSILARRITRAVIAHPCRIEFADGSESFDAIAVRDGITRLTSAWALLTSGESPAADDIADTALGVLLAEKSQRRGAASKPRSQRMALGRQSELAGLHSEFQQGVGAGQPADRSVRLGQTLVVPAQITVGVRRHGSMGLQAREVFDDAVRSILASVHVEFRPWEAAAQNVEVGSRAIRRVRLPGLPADNLLDGIINLALGRRRPEEVPDIFNSPETPGTPLWRAVHLVHFLTRPDVFEQVKRYAKDIKGTKVMKNAGYAELLGPIVDLPWRGTKAGSLKQARNSWANGGVLTDGVMSEWSPAPSADFTELVSPAIEGDADARQTLAVAGGTALIADKLLTRNVGSAVGSTVPFRANVDKVVAGLTQSEEGLWTLAFAAQAFDAERECRNSFTKSQLTGRNTAHMYIVPAVDVSQEDRKRRDQGGVAYERLTQWEVVSTSDPDKAREAEQQSPPPGVHEISGPTINDRLATERRALRQAVAAARKAVARLREIGESPEARATTLHLFGSDKELADLVEDIGNLGGAINVHRQNTTVDAGDGEEARDHVEGASLV